MSQPHDSPPKSGHEALVRLREVIASGRPILGAGAGTGISAKFIEKGGADLIILYNSGKYRMAGRGSLAGLMPYGDANAMMLEMAREIIPIIKHTILIAGVCASDPFRSIPRFLQYLKSLGFIGVQNFPTVGLIDADSVFRANLEETGMGYECEVQLVREAKKLGLLTTMYAFTEDEARRMAGAGAEVIVAHMGLTTKGSIGAKTGRDLVTCIPIIEGIVKTIRAIAPATIILVHGGPIAEPADAEYILTRVEGLSGFYGASSLERLSVEKALQTAAEEFKSINFIPQSKL